MNVTFAQCHCKTTANSAGKKHISTVVLSWWESNRIFETMQAGCKWKSQKILLAHKDECLLSYGPLLNCADPSNRSNKCSHNKTKHTSWNCINPWPPTRCAKFSCRVNQRLCISGTMITGRTSVITPGKVKGYNLNAASGSHSSLVIVKHLLCLCAQVLIRYDCMSVVLVSYRGGLIWPNLPC